MNRFAPIFRRWARLCGVGLLALVGTWGHASGLQFGLIAKSVDDENFIAAWRGCEAAARPSGDRCVLLGAGDKAHARRQAHAVREAVGAHLYDGLAISVMNSAMVRQALGTPSIPVISYDSPFEVGDQQAQRAYVGIDNEAFGGALARIATTLRPEGGTVCLLSAAFDTNLAQRLLGIRRTLSADPAFPPGRRLKGEGGWIEPARCPLDTSDSVPRTMTELKFLLGHLRPGVVISTGHWPVIDAQRYRRTVEAEADLLKRRKTLMIAGIGAASPEILSLTRDGLLHGYVSIDFEAMGRESYTVLRALSDRKPVPEKVVSPVKTYTVPGQ